MQSASVAQRIGDISAGQWGMITTAQARTHGVARANLAHRVRTGELERTNHYGVYRLAAAASSPLDDLRAAWLSTNPRELAADRTSLPRPDAVVASAAAATVHGIGDVYSAPYRIIVPGRRQSSTGAIAYSWRPLDSRDVELVDGLPVTTRERTIVDLLGDEGDVSIAADAMRDALRGEYDLDETRLAELLTPYAERLGQASGDGRGALSHLMVTAEVDAASEASRALDRLLTSQIRLPGIEAFINKVISNMPALAATLPEVTPNAATLMAAALAPTRDALNNIDTAALSRIVGVNARLLGEVANHSAIGQQAANLANIQAGLASWKPTIPTIRLTTPPPPHILDEDAARADKRIEQTGPATYRLREPADSKDEAEPGKHAEDATHDDD
ncbi:type IV toxin-antitoxin system AbiEi family antitoxin domain-containing protein [Frigoribacterium sp. CFBP 13707]|uniref:type IV toxin-antitoxin system AbiEi family antitoxin domain-containing protein n=1 Tax=Frigoribacterium sp. CFBP 13707 TaxID=2775313 RepID=UPI00178477F0|nr:type IV toxin-antitoxin system AbiEi family antitoxin domain-containing protein [Frigoribacterium sp. CFBP 13707]MBD8729399.1 type IV toxin-antitoxin system AbiEi family antitoxin domain-containing protein [Frigoribacterium sp. CFBP 13707]